jgi:hypothetical protein
VEIEPMRTANLCILASVGLAIASLPAAAQSTTRIETRPFYGATVTMEEGVRVFRPLPPHERIIINPDKVPISLAFSTNYSYSHNYVYSVSDIPTGRYAMYNFVPNRHMRNLGRHRGGKH